jgi:hypothetical protein
MRQHTHHSGVELYRYISARCNDDHRAVHKHRITIDDDWCATDCDVAAVRIAKFGQRRGIEERKYMTTVLLITHAPLMHSAVGRGAGCTQPAGRGVGVIPVVVPVVELVVEGAVTAGVVAGGNVGGGVPMGDTRQLSAM